MFNLSCINRSPLLQCISAFPMIDGSPDMARPNTSIVNVVRPFTLAPVDVALVLADLMLTLITARVITVILKKPLQNSCPSVRGSGRVLPMSLA